MLQSEVPEVDRMSLIWAFVCCLIIPVVIPATFLAISNIVLIAKVDLPSSGNVSKVKLAAKKIYNPFSLSIREMAIKIASGPGNFSCARNNSILNTIVLYYYRNWQYRCIWHSAISYVYISDINKFASDNKHILTYNKHG